MPRIGLISDTHGWLDPAVYDAFAHVDYIIHAGDIGSPMLLWELETIAPVLAVLGNNDWDEYGSCVRPSLSTLHGGVAVFVTHFPYEAEDAARSGDYGLVVHGHTHVPRDELVGACRIVNPGSATRPRGGSSACVALVELSDGVVGPVRTVEL